MGVTFKSTNNIPRIKDALMKLDRREIKVGIFGEDNYKYGNDADLLTIARVHEYGTTITPKGAKWLTIPIVPEAKNKRASDFGDQLFFYKKSEEVAFLAKKSDQGEVKNIFLLLKSVTIPERSFLRTGFDTNVNDIADKLESMLNDVIDLEINPDVFLDMIGLEFAGLIQRHMRTVDSPPNASITARVKGSDNPLQDTGRLIGAIRHKVE